MTEQWQTIKDLNNYAISNYGRVLNKKTGKFIKSSVGGTGYPSVCIYTDDGRRVFRFIHRLVAEAFIPNPNNFECVNHIDENRLNPYYENLEWTTRERNSSIRTNRKNARRKETKVLNSNGEIITYTRSIREAAAYLNIHFSTAIKHYHSGKITQGGFYIKPATGEKHNDGNN